MLRFSIIVPCFNAATTIDEAVRSAVAQDYPDFEVVVTDNGSTDGSAQTIANIEHPRLRSLLHGETIDRTSNWNRAYEAAGDCDYLVTLHADDRLNPGALSAIARAARDRPGLIHGGYGRLAHDGAPLPSRSFPASYRCSGEEFGRLTLLANIVNMVGVTMRRDLFAEMGGWDRHWTFMQDLEMWWRLRAHGPIAYASTPLGDYRDTPGTAPRHSEEHIRWTLQTMDSLSPGLRKWAATGLVHYIARLEAHLKRHALTPDAALATAIHRAHEALAGQPLLPMDNVKLQRVLRLFYAGRSMVWTPKT